MANEKKETKSSKVDNLVEEVGKLTVVELSELVSALKEKFGVEGVAMSAPIAAAPVVQPATETPATTQPATEAPTATPAAQPATPTQATEQ